MKNDQSAIARILLDAKAVTLNVDHPYTYSSGIRSPIYCDNRLLITKVQTRNKIVQAFCSQIQKIQPKQIAGVATAGISWGAWIAQALELPYIYVRSKPKGHGKEKQIEGDFVVEKTLLIEDLISTGKSSLEALNGLQKENVPAIGLIAIFTYGLSSAVQAFEKENLPIYTLTNLDVLLDVAVEGGFLRSDQKNEVLQWRENPETWFKG